MMKITYIYHSCFCVELESCVLIFDYYKGDIPAIPVGKPVYFFASHKHQDHFNLFILNMLPEYNPKFIISNDIRLSQKYLERYGIDSEVSNSIFYVKKHDEITVDNILIRTIKSTDMGCAFLIEADGITIFHAGDFNIWAMPDDERAELLLKYQQRLFNEELARIKGTVIDVAFFPLDVRLQESYYLGMKCFLENMEVKYMFPMHMWEQYDIVDRAVNNELKDYRDIIMRVNDEIKEWIF